MIYATPFDSSKTATGPSRPAGFPSLSAVKQAMGGRVLVYGQGDQQVAFSDFIFSAEADHVPESGLPNGG